MLTRTLPRTRDLRSLSPHGFHRVAYYEWGDPANQNVVVCVHGLTRNGRDFDVLAEALATTHRVIAVDMPGRGTSDWLADPNDYGGIGIDFTKSKTVIMYFRGSTVSTMAMLLPLLPGSTSDPATLRGKLAARLKADVLGHLLRHEYWEWERATTTGEPYLRLANPVTPPYHSLD